MHEEVEVACFDEKRGEREVKAQLPSFNSPKLPEILSFAEGLAANPEAQEGKKLVLKAKSGFEEAEILGEIGILKEKVVITLKKYERLLEKIKKEKRLRSFEETKEHIGEDLREIYRSFSKFFVKYFDLPENLQSLLETSGVESTLEVTQKLREIEFSLSPEKDSELNVTLMKINDFLAQFSQFLRNPLGVDTAQAKIPTIAEEGTQSQDQISSATSQLSKTQTKEELRKELRAALQREKYRPARKITTEGIEIYCKKCDDYKPCMIYEYHSCLLNTGFRKSKINIKPERKQAKDLINNVKGLLEKFEKRFLNDIRKDPILKNNWERIRGKIETVGPTTEMNFIKKNLEEIALFGDGSVGESGLKAFVRRFDLLCEKIMDGYSGPAVDDEGVLLTPSPFVGKLYAPLRIDNVLSD